MNITWDAIAALTTIIVVCTGGAHYITTLIVTNAVDKLRLEIQQALTLAQAQGVRMDAMGLQLADIRRDLEGIEERLRALESQQ